MSTQKNTDPYEAALTAVVEALDGLSERRLYTAMSLDMKTLGAEYDVYRHTMATGEYAGVNDAHALVTAMLNDYRKASA